MIYLCVDLLKQQAKLSIQIKSWIILYYLQCTTLSTLISKELQCYNGILLFAWIVELWRGLHAGEKTKYRQ